MGASELDRLVSRMIDTEDGAGILALVRNSDIDPRKPVIYYPTGEPLDLLQSSIRHNWTDVALALIERDADVNRRLQGQTPLMTACAFGNHAVIEALLVKGAKLDLKTPKGEGDSGDTALMIASEKHDPRAVALMLGAGADSRILNCRQQSAIHYALIPRPTPETIAVVSALLQADCPLLGTELHFAVFRRDVEIVGLLVERGTPLDAHFAYNEMAGPKRGETPLTTAVREQHTDSDDLLELGLPSTETQRIAITAMLLAAGADPNVPGPMGQSPLLIAVSQRHYRLVEMLIQAGADPNLVPPGSKHRSPLQLAREKADSALIGLCSLLH